MLNALIAIMGNTYAEVQEKMRERQLLQRGNLLTELQDQVIMLQWISDAVRRLFLSKAIVQQRRDLVYNAMFPKWLHILDGRERKSEAAGSGAGKTEKKRILLGVKRAVKPK